MGRTARLKAKMLQQAVEEADGQVTEGSGPPPPRFDGAELKAEAERTAAELDAWFAEHLSEEDIAASRVDAAKDTARLLGMQIARRIMTLGGTTAADLTRLTGIDAATISRIAKGKRASGPQLWTLLALADAAGVKLQLSVAKPE